MSDQTKAGDDDGEVMTCDTPACLLEECLCVPEKEERKEKEDVGYTSRRKEKEERRERRGREKGERRGGRKEEGEREL